MGIIGAVFKGVVSVSNLLWQGVLFVWLLFVTLGEWLHSIVPGFLKVNSLLSQLALFIVSLLFIPAPWWVCLLFIFVPTRIGISVLLTCFIFYFIVGLAQSTMFL